MRRTVCKSPDTVPVAIPVPTAASSASVLPTGPGSARSTIAAIAAASAMTPCTDRSMLPIRMTKVAPVASSSGMTDSASSRPRLAALTKAGL